MTTFALLASGPSMSQALADRLRPLRRIAVGNTFELATDAEALVAIDVEWWKAYPESMKFAGRKFCVSYHPQKLIEVVEPVNGVHTGWNSTLLAIHVAITRFAAKRIELHGVDMTAKRGAHYFGDHKNGRSNTTASRFETFKRQFAAYQIPKDVRVVNCTPGSQLLCYPFEIEECAPAI